VICGQTDRWQEAHLEEYLLSGRRTFAACSLIWFRMYTVDDGVRYHEA
jgi:hypothetical protein